MKRFLLAAVLTCFSYSSQAAVVWQGEAVIESASSQCSSDVALGPTAGKILKTVLRPRNLSDNGVNTHISFIANQITMFAMILDQGAMPSGTAAVFGNDASGLIKANVGVPYSSFVQRPASIALTTENVALEGTITNFLYVAGCTVAFRAAYSRRN